MARKFKAFIERPKPRKRPRRHTKSLNKHKKRQVKSYNRQGRKQQLDKYPLRSYIESMKEKIITIKPKGISQKQWSVFILELNLMKRAWKSYGVDMEIKAPGLKNIINWGTKKYGTADAKDRRSSSHVEQNQRS